MTTTLPAPTDAYGRHRPGLAGAAGYLLTGFPIALPAFIVLVTGLAVGLGTLPIVLGLAVLALTLQVARGFAAVERTRLDLLWRTRTPRPAYKAGQGPVRATLAAGADPRRWLDLAHGIVSFPVTVVTWCVTVAWFAGALSGLSYVLWEWSLPRDDADDETLAELVGLGDGRLADVLLTTALGAVLAVTLPFVVRGCAAVQSSLAYAMLTARTDD